MGMVTKAKTVSARGRTGPLGATAGAEQEKGRAAWGTRWEAHLEKMLKRWGVDGGRGDDTRGGGNSAADQVFVRFCLLVKVKSCFNTVGLDLDFPFKIQYRS